MGFILSWKGFFIRKRRDPRRWAEFNEIDSYEKCVKLINKKCLVAPTLEEYNEFFAPPKPPAPPPQPPKELKPEPKPEPEPVEPRRERAPEPAPEEKPPPKKKATRKRAPRKPKTSSEAGSGTSSIIDSVKKKPATRKTRSRKNVKTS